MRLDGRRALVTGSSRGIGRAIALKLAAEGADVAVNYVTQARAAGEVVDRIHAAGRSSFAVRADVSLAISRGLAIFRLHEGMKEELHSRHGDCASVFVADLAADWNCLKRATTSTTASKQYRSNNSRDPTSH